MSSFNWILPKETLNMQGFNRLPPEIILRIFKSIPLKDLYLSFGSYKLFIIPECHLLFTSQSDLENNFDQNFVQSFKNIDHVKDFQDKLDLISKSTFFFIVVSGVRDLLAWYNDLTNIYITLTERKKSIIFIVDHKSSLPFAPDINLMILRFVQLFNSKPPQNRCLLVFKDIELFEFPWNIDFLNKFKLIDHKESFQYFLNNLIINHPPNPIFNTYKMTEQEVQLPLIKVFQQGLGKFDIEENIMVTNAEMVTINLTTDDARSLSDALDPRFFDLLNYNLKTIKRICFNIRHDLQDMTHLNVLNQFLIPSPNIFDKIRYMTITFDYHLDLRFLSFPNLETLTIQYNDPVVGYQTPKGSKVLKLAIEDIHFPKLESLQISHIQYNSLIFKLTAKGNKLKLRKDFCTKANSSDRIEKRKNPLYYTSVIKTKQMVNSNNIFGAGLTFAIVRSKEEYGNYEIAVLGDTDSIVENYNIDNYSVSLTVYADKEQYLNLLS